MVRMLLWLKMVFILSTSTVMTSRNFKRPIPRGNSESAQMNAVNIWKVFHVSSLRARFGGIFKDYFYSSRFSPWFHSNVDFFFFKSNNANKTHYFQCTNRLHCRLHSVHHLYYLKELINHRMCFVCIFSAWITHFSCFHFQ